MALSVSSFPETIYIPPPEPNFESPTSSAKRRKMFGGIFSKDASTLFSSRHRRAGADSPKSSKSSIVLEEAAPVLSISPRESAEERVIDVSGPKRKPKPTLPALSVPTTTDPELPTVASKAPPELVFPPTPTAAEPSSVNPMKESIKALRLSRIHRPIDWARKDENEPLPSWASRGVIASFGHPEQAAPHEDDRNRSSSSTSATTSSSLWSRFSRPSTSPSPSSRTSSGYWTAATVATSPASAKSRNGTFQSAGSDHGSRTFSFRRLSTSSAKSYKTSASASSAKPVFVMAPFTGSMQHKRARTLSDGTNVIAKLQGKLKPVPTPAPSAHETSRPRERARTLSNTSAKAKGKMKASPKPLVFNADSHPPVPRLPLTALPNTSRRNRSAHGARAGSSSRSRPSGSSNQLQTKSAPTTPIRKHAELPSVDPAPPLPIAGPSRLPIGPSLSTAHLHAPTPVSASSSPQLPRAPYELPAQVRNLPKPPRALPVPPISLPPSQTTLMTGCWPVRAVGVGPSWVGSATRPQSLLTRPIG
ncbi:hypothetical protein FA95DRAFT_1575495 [Auriscalpium vulgare]|uniref:Uncharacterized protein n=1 Tax=Auriscalpium vulgare TaxID=40419 RepID=A0ACB8RFM6_9AGAM|nr:hypothetical protein FA95DRAFT_1575495 [Auriscalpium vulgare]